MSNGKARTQRTAGIGAVKLRSKPSMARNVSEPQALLTENAIRAFVEAQTCPFCGSGPWKSITVHTSKMHGVDKRELRDMAGIPYGKSVTSPESRARRIDAIKRVGIPEGFQTKSAAARAARGRKKSVALSRVGGSGAARVREIAEVQHEEAIEWWAQSDQSWDAVRLFASETGRSMKTAKHYLKSICGLAVPDGRSAALPGTPEEIPGVPEFLPPTNKEN